MSAIPVYALVGDHHFDVSMTCLGSLRDFCRDDYQLHLLNAGNLTSTQRDALGEQFPAARLWDQVVMRETLAPFLRGRPYCEKFLDELVLAWKLLAPPALAESVGGDLLVVDSDVIFYRAVSGLDRRANPAEDFVYCHEDRDSYSVAFKDRYWGADKIQLPEGGKSGLVFMRAGTFDWDFVEWFLTRPAYRAYFNVAEQTAWAALGARCGKRCFYFDPAQINIPEGRGDVTPALVGQHLVGDRKALARSEKYLEIVRAMVGENASGDVARLGTCRAAMRGLIASLPRKVFGALGGKKSGIAAAADPAAFMIDALRRSGLDSR
jgi:hypothetical protein